MEKCELSFLKTDYIWFWKMLRDQNWLILKKKVETFSVIMKVYYQKSSQPAKRKPHNQIFTLLQATFLKTIVFLDCPIN